jgi:nicotinamide-nucleotide amidase
VSKVSPSVRAGIVVTGTEVLTGRVADRNGPWLADRLEELGVDLAHVVIVGDRRADLLAALRFLAGEGLDVVLTSGGLGPTADDLTAEVVGEFQGRPPVWDEALHVRIEARVAPLARRWRNIDPEALREGTHKQATVPAGAVVLDPVGTAPGLVVTPAEGALGRGAVAGTGAGEDGPATRGPTVVVLPGPPRELQPMWLAAVESGALRTVLAGATVYRRRTLRLFGMPESEIAQTLRVAAAEGVELERLEVTTCLKRGEVEVVTRYEPSAQDAYDALVAVVRARHADTLFSEDGATVDEQVAALLRGEGLSAGTVQPGSGSASEPAAAERPGEASGAQTPAGGWTIATAESCTGGLLAARLTELPGASEYVRGALVAYANDAKTGLAGVPEELIARHGAVSVEVAAALAEGARVRVGADVGVGVTGVAGPSGGAPEKPVGFVCFAVAGPGEVSLARSVNLPGGRADVRDRATTVALHMVRRALLGGRE